MSIPGEVSHHTLLGEFTMASVSWINETTDVIETVRANKKHDISTFMTMDAFFTNDQEQRTSDCPRTVRGSGAFHILCYSGGDPQC